MRVHVQEKEVQIRLLVRIRGPAECVRGGERRALPPCLRVCARARALRLRVRLPQAPHARADIVHLSEDIEVVRTWIGGE